MGATSYNNLVVTAVAVDVAELFQFYVNPIKTRLFPQAGFLIPDLIVLLAVLAKLATHSMSGETESLGLSQNDRSSN